MELHGGLDWLDVPHCEGAPGCHNLADMDYKGHSFCKYHYKQIAFDGPVIDDNVQRQLVSDVKAMLAAEGILT